MAENEYLDSTKARRWHSVVQVIRGGGSVEEVADSVEECFFKTLRQIRKDLPLADMIRAMENPDELMRVCQLVDGGEDVKDFIRQAALEKSSRADQLRQFLANALANCLYDIPYMAALADDSTNISQVRAMSAEVRQQLANELERIADKLTENPDWIPRRAGRGQPAVSKDERTRKMLGESLLSGHKK